MTEQEQPEEIEGPEPEEAAASQPETSPAIEMPEIAEIPLEPEVQEPSRIGLFFGSLLRWAVGLLFVFAVGIVLTWLVRVRPLGQQITRLRAEVGAAQERVDSLESELALLRPLRTENSALREAMERTGQHLDTLQVLVDVTSARLAVEQEDMVSARAALASTDERLAVLEAGLSGQNAEVVAGMRERLGLVLDELGDDAFAARRDLEVLANNLLTLERSLFGES